MLEARPAFERSVSVYYLSFAHQWLGHYDDTLRLRFRLLQLAEQSGSPLWIASACICLGAFLTQEMLDPEKGLPYLQRARAIWAAHEMTDITLVATTQTIVALDMLGRHDEAFAVFAEDTARDGAMARVDPQRAERAVLQHRSKDRPLYARPGRGDARALFVLLDQLLQRWPVARL